MDWDADGAVGSRADWAAVLLVVDWEAEVDWADAPFPLEAFGPELDIEGPPDVEGPPDAEGSPDDGVPASD